MRSSPRAMQRGPGPPVPAADPGQSAARVRGVAPGAERDLPGVLGPGPDPQYVGHRPHHRVPRTRTRPRLRVSAGDRPTRCARPSNNRRSDMTSQPDPRRWWALALLCLAFFMVILDAQIVVLGLPTIESDLDMSADAGQWVMSAYLLSFGGLLLLGGRSADLLGRRKMFLIGTALFLVASLVCGLAWSGEVLIGARVAQGVSAAIMAPTALSILMTTFDEGAERNKALGIWSAVGGVGATAALLVGGPLTDGPGWEWIFYLNVPVALGMLAVGPRLLRESRVEGMARTYDPAGATTITGALVLLVYGIVEAPDAGWISGQTVGLLLLAACLVAAFAVVERRSAAPLVP